MLDQLEQLNIFSLKSILLEFIPSLIDKFHKRIPRFLKNNLRDTTII